MGWLKEKWQKFPSYLRPIIVAFVLINLFFPLIGGYNPASRLALMASLSENASVFIDRYAEGNSWTNDWALGIDGHKVSNKAPGAALLAFPLYFLIDKVSHISAPNLEQRDRIRFRSRHFSEHLISLVYQVFFLVIILLWAFTTGPWKALSPNSKIYLSMVLCFAQTGSLFFNTFFGHALLCTMTLLSYLLFVEKSYFYSAVSASLCVLIDYSALPWLLVLVAAFLITKEHTLNRQSIAKFCVGLLPALLLWMIYHWAAFGTPWTLSLQHQNPSFRDSQNTGLWGILNSLPSMGTLLKLLFGFERGMLWTQPWIFVLLFFALRIKKAKSTQKYFLKASGLYFVLLLLLNASFGGWHGGGAPGPRYLSAPIWILTAVVPWESFNFKKNLLWNLMLIYSLVFYSSVLSTQLLLPVESLWPHLFSLFNESPTRYLKLVLIVLGLTGAIVYSFRQAPRQE